MMNVRTSAALAMGIVTVFLVGLASGCASVDRRRPDYQFDGEARGRLADAPDAAEIAEETTLAAVEEFLERTVEYDLAAYRSSAIHPAPATKVASAASSVTPEPAGGPDRSLPADISADESPRAFANMQVALQTPTLRKPAPALPVLQSVSIRSVSQPVVEADDPIKMHTTNEPLDVKTADGPMPFDKLLSYLEQRSNEAGDFESEWQLRLVQLALHRDAEALQVAGHVPHESRGLLVALIRAAVAVRGMARDPSLTGEGTLGQIDELRRVIADRADPVVDAVTLCRKVVTFGVYEEMAPGDFVAGQSTQAIVYSEVRNLRSEVAEDGRYQTRLSTRLELLATDGRSVWQREPSEIIDRCRRPRTDFFIAQRMTLPATLPVGDYVLKVFVEDGLSGKAAEANYPLAITSLLSAAEGP
jgi:hypothetical protein